VAIGTLLKPSYTKGYDISAAYKELISLTYFHNKVEDSIDYVGVWPNAGYANIDGTSKFSGVQVESTYMLDEYNLIFSANYTHLIDYKKEDGTDLPRRAEDTLNASLTYYTENNMHFGLDAQYIGDREEFGQSTGNYTLWNFNFSTELIDDILLNLNAKNIFDKEYESIAGYATAERSFYAKIKYSF